MSRGLKAAVLEAVGWFLALAATSGTIVYGVRFKLNSGEKAVADAWGGDSFATLGWIAILLLLAATVRAVRGRQDSIAGLLSVALGGQVLFGAGVAGVSLAWGAERQNYWEAYQFAVLAWDAILGAAAALLCVILAARRGSRAAQVLVGPASFWVFAVLLAWTWTWSDSVQGLEASITRDLFLATHR